MRPVLAWAGSGLLFGAGAQSVLDADTRDEGASGTLLKFYVDRD